MEYCKRLIKKGLIIRYILTIAVIYIVSKTIHNEYIFFLLPVILSLLDSVDGIFIHWNGYDDNIQNKSKCHKILYYQLNDKICDSISYLLIPLFFKVDNILLLFILYRIIGVILFYFTKSSKWLIIFFDFVKEYLIYLFIFKKNYVYIPLFMFVKICFEYYFHIFVNQNNYT